MIIIIIIMIYIIISDFIWDYGELPFPSQLGGFQKNAAFYIFTHLLNSIGLASNLQCSNY